MKKLAVLQSNYIPWKGYFDIIHDVDEFIFYDEVQFTKNDWRNRNKILTPQGEVWLTVPVGMNKIHRSIVDVQIKDSSWQRKHFKTLEMAYHKAPYWKRYEEFLASVYLEKTWTYLYELNRFLIEHIARDFLGITTKFTDSRDYPTHGVKHEKLLSLVKAAQADLYLSGPATKDYIVAEDYAAADIQLVWKDYSNYPAYPQRGGGGVAASLFITFLSWICSLTSATTLRITFGAGVIHNRQNLGTLFAYKKTRLKLVTGHRARLFLLPKNIKSSRCAMKKILLLGAGIGQMPFLKICRAKGYEVLVVSPRGDYPGLKLADKAFFVDVRDKETVLKIAAAEKIDAVLTDQADVSVPTVAYVAEKLNLRGIGYETALKFTDKYLMRKAAKAAGVAVPEFNQAFNLAEAVDIAEGMSYPLIIKPADSSGSRGVRRINSADDLKREFNSTKTFSMSGKVILERFIEGNVYCADGYAVNNEHRNLVLGITVQFDLPGRFIPAMRIFSSIKRVTDRAGQMLLAENEKLVTSMKLPFGITHAEYIYNAAEDKVYLTEIAARGGGNYISSDLTTLATGFDTNEALIDYVVNGTVRKFEPDKLDDKVSAYVDFGFPADGVVKNIAGLDALKKIPGVYKVHMENCYVGKKVARLTDGTKRYGMILIAADDEDECRKVIAEVKRTLVVEIETADGLQKQLW